jgi:hypothetical protein
MNGSGTTVAFAGAPNGHSTSSIVPSAEIGAVRRRICVASCRIHADRDVGFQFHSSNGALQVEFDKLRLS